MDKWSKLPPKEIERRRKISNDVMKARSQAEWQAEYQAHCDKTYWKIGKCCAGCDHWRSEGANMGECGAAGIVSGQDVLRSMGISFSSRVPAPGFPYTRSDHRCGLFSDAFDWSTLDLDYLSSIGAIRNGKLRDKPA